ncbi:DUF4124 domain-containing protein [Marinicella meishanensis]|uniref:DUF4124 domain-containing protein n=1 Tax=Marinicella meishanensis TaxID=2873263 RepID=UPI001CBF7CCB|nr:DUF4124 domain-containing protein [Marinicella sp. NBU2979]
MNKTSLWIIALLIVAGSAWSQVYKWVDENGVTHYSAKPPEGQANNAKEMKVKGMQRSVDSVSNSPAGASECETIVRHGLTLMEIDIKKENVGQAADAMIALLKDPGTVADGVAECQKDMQDPVKAQIWACQQKAQTFQALRDCEKSS